MESKILEEFQKISASVYDVVGGQENLKQNDNKQLSHLRDQIESLRAQFNQPTHLDQPMAQLSKTDRETAEFLAKCVSVCPRMTAVQLNTEGKLVCGGVVLKPGDSADNIQANWDLIDTCTGADS